jgi:hypothetical protein
MITINNTVISRRQELINLIIWVDNKISFASEVLYVEPTILNLIDTK